MVKKDRINIIQINFSAFHSHYLAVIFSLLRWPAANIATCGRQHEPVTSSSPLTTGVGRDSAFTVLSEHPESMVAILFANRRSALAEFLSSLRRSRRRNLQRCFAFMDFSVS